MPVRENYRDDNQKVTAGLPSLSPEKRRELTETQLTYIYQKACQNEYKHNEEEALAPDGAIGDVSNWEEIVGIPLQGWQICVRLKKLSRKLGHNLWFERSKAAPEQLGIYLLKNDFKGGQTKEFICGMQAELNPEFTLRVKNDDGTPKGIIPGWRRVLMKLIRKNLISESGAHSMFGPPSRDSENWARFVN